MSVQIKEIASYENYGRCVRFDNGEIEALVTVDVGPRIIRYGFIGKENVMWNDLNREAFVDGAEMESFFGKGRKWYIYGGHRLWFSPEDLPRSYYPENDPVMFEISGDTVTFTPKAQTENGLQFSFSVTMKSDGALDIEHTITSIDKDVKCIAPWALTVLNQGGLEIIPQNDHDTGLLQNRVMSVWPYTDMSDPRVYFGKKFITLRQDVNATGNFKIGLDNKKGYIVYLLNETALIKKYTHDDNAVYPDYGVSFETFTNKHFLEMETLGGIKNLNKGQTLELKEQLILKKHNGKPDARNEVEIENTVRSLGLF